MKTFKQILESTKLNEKLTKSDDIGDYITDFVNSKDPRFEGKSKEERIKMAKGAYYGKQNESVELDEDKEYIEQHLADKDINSSVNGKTVKVHSSNVSATKRHLSKAGYKDHKVVSGLNESDDSREYDYEGEMAVTQLTTAIRHAEHLKDMMKPNTNLPEWVQSKITLATDYLQTAHDYLMSEMSEEVEQIDELSKNTLGSYIKKASDRKAIAAVGMMNIRDPDSDKHMDKFQKRNMGIKKAVDKLTKEEVEELDEISKDTLASYATKAFAAGNTLHDKIKAETDPEKKAKLQAKLTKRNLGVMKAGAKFRSEETELDEETEEQKKARQEFDLKMAKAKNSQRATKALNKEETMLSFTEFGLAISEGRLDDLRDKMEVDKANTSAYSDKFKPSNNSKIGVKKVPARSYGAGEENDNEEEDVNKEKRGRGRPAGSKSGARA
jgi:hypothetical protein